jgi:hypothetical protein
MEEGILVHKGGMGYYRFGALRHEGIQLLQSLLKPIY